MKNISIDHLPVGIFKIDLDNNITYVNSQFCQITSSSKEKLLGENWLNKIHQGDRQVFIRKLAEHMDTKTPYEFEFRFISYQKKDVWVLCHLVPEISKKEITHYIGVITDITSFKLSQINLQEIRFDPLTELPNRYLFEDLLSKSMSRSKRNKSTLALFYIDLDYFKNVNDYFGHGTGDALLKEAGKRLIHSIRMEDYAVRLGGDEFAIILENIQNISTISLAAERIINAFRRPFLVNNHEITSSLSIGISVYPDEETTVESIVQHADQALYQAKDSGRNCYKYYNKMMQQKLERYMLILTNLREAINKDEFELYYQPKIDLLTESLVGMEALLRWNSPEVSSASPGEFIVIAEENGLMNQIGAWIISAALNQYKIWCDNIKKMKHVKISINISPSQLNDSSILETVAKVLKETGTPPNNILFELTETAVMKKALDEKSVFQVFLAELGIGISIDDFGTGYSSFTYLKELPIKELKIDKSFIDGIGTFKNSESIIKAIINLSQTLEIDVVAEGVETKRQLQFLQKNNCNIIQGYYYSKPLSATEMTEYINIMSTFTPQIIDEIIEL